MEIFKMDKTVAKTEGTPLFSLKDALGKTYCNADFHGKWLILYFYPKDDTPGCTAEACDFRDNFAFLQSNDTVVAGISPDSAESHVKFIDKYSLNLTLLSDPEKKTIQDFGAWGIKKNYGKEYEGLIRSTFLIDPEGNTVFSWRNVRAKGHVQRVLEKFKQIRNIT
jgi:peroxiredoxin Q/BCP